MCFVAAEADSLILSVCQRCDAHVKIKRKSRRDSVTAAIAVRLFHFPDFEPLQFQLFKNTTQQRQRWNNIGRIQTRTQDYAGGLAAVNAEVPHHNTKSIKFCGGKLQQDAANCVHPALLEAACAALRRSWKLIWRLTRVQLIYQHRWW